MELFDEIAVIFILCFSYPVTMFVETTLWPY